MCVCVCVYIYMCVSVCVCISFLILTQSYLSNMLFINFILYLRTYDIEFNVHYM